MKALVIAPQPFFTARGTPFSVYYRTMVTAQLGVQVDLLTYGEGQDVEIPGVRIIRIPRFAGLGNVRVGPSPLKLFLDVFLLVWTLGLLLRRRYDFVHAHEEAVFFCRFLKPIFRFKLIYDMHSSLPQQLTNFAFTKSKLLIGLFKWLEDESIRTCDAVITICPALEDYVDGLIGKHQKHLLIENSIFDDVRLASTNSSSATAGARNAEPTQAPQLLVGRKLIVYAGTLEPYQGVDMLIQAFTSVIAEEPGAKLLIVGGTETQVEACRTLAARQGADEHCVFAGWVPQKLAKHYNSIACIIVSPRIAGTNTPLKIYEQLASGIPLVATKIFSHTQVLDDDVAFLSEPHPQAFARGILEALSHPDRAARKVAAAKRLYEKKYSREAYESKMRRLLDLVR